MKNLFSLLILSIFLFSCNSYNLDQEPSLTAKVETETKSVEKVSSGEFSNPAIIYGTDFLTFFKSLRKLGKFDEMVKFTSSESLKEFGKDELKSYYENNFVNMSDSKLQSMTKVDNENFVMHYTNSEFATKRAFDVKVTIENDSTKLVLVKKYPF